MPCGGGCGLAWIKRDPHTLVVVVVVVALPAGLQLTLTSTSTHPLTLVCRRMQLNSLEGVDFWSLPPLKNSDGCQKRKTSMVA